MEFKELYSFYENFGEGVNGVSSPTPKKTKKKSAITTHASVISTKSDFYTQSAISSVILHAE
jgi:hypothetical protein